MPKGTYGVSNLYRAPRKMFLKNTPPDVFKSWENMLSGPDYARVILEGWSNVRKHILRETWRETHFR